MENKINISEIQFAASSQYDVVGRVFFARNRVFRAITYEAADSIKEFLDSSLFKELRKRHWIVDSWITSDVQIQGYAYCLEHEKLFDSTAKEWSFDMMRDAAVFTIELNNLCCKYGYILKDALFDNICFYKGKPCHIDIGSFRNISRGTNPYYKYYFTWNIYIFLDMFRQGADMLARSLLNGWLIEKPFIVPDCKPESINGIQRYVKRAIKGTDYYVRVKLPHIKIPSCLHLTRAIVSGLVDGINVLVRKISSKPKDWKFVKSQPIYKNFTEKDIVSIKPKYQEYPMQYPIEKDDTILHIGEYCKEHSELSKELHRVVWLGNYNPLVIESCCREIENIVISSDANYVDYMYHQIADNQLNVHPICFNIFAPSATNLTHAHADLIVCDTMLFEWQTPTTPEYQFQPPRALISIVETLSKCTRSYLIIPTLDDAEMHMFYVRFKPICTIDGEHILLCKL